MSRSSGPGSPVAFVCPVVRRLPFGRRRYSEHVVTLTGRERPYRSPRFSALGLRSDPVSREYRCSCGRVGWSNHSDLRPRGE